MTLLIVLLAGFAVAAAALCWRDRRRWRHIRARPVVTCEQVTGLPPGQFVVLTGRTSDEPLMKSPYTGRVCVDTGRRRAGTGMSVRTTSSPMNASTAVACPSGSPTAPAWSW